MHARPQGPSVGQVLARMDEDWAAFRGRIAAIPLERLADPLGDGAWSRKQMLAHIVTWHDLTVDRLSRFAESGEPQGLEGDADAINARAARAAEGRTTGEILLALDDSFRRLRRVVVRLSDGQLYVHDGWAAAVIAGNSYDHYAEHRADLD